MKWACVICYLCLPSPWLYYIFSTLSHKRHDFSKKYILIKCVCWLPLQCLSETFIILKRNERDVVIYVHRSSCKVDFHSCYVLMKLEFSWQIFEKFSNMKFHENPFSGSRVVPCGRTGRHDVANSHFSQFCERA